MKPLIVEVIDIKYRRPGLNKLQFEAVYPQYRRRGTVVYDINTQHFLTHTSDIELLAALCTSLQRPRYNKTG
jgi:hypothetical protein